MSRIEQTLQDLKARQGTALVPFITAGYPNKALFPEILHDFVKAGADMIELGMPFSDPIADGSVIQAANDQALAQGINLPAVFDMVEKFRRKNEVTPIILMGYTNPIECYGFQAFFDKAKAIGVDGIVMVDCPPEENHQYRQMAQQAGIDMILLVAPTTPLDRMAIVGQSGAGFIYYVSLKGVTGSSELDVETVHKRVAMLREKTDLPVGVGFGVRTAQDAAKIAEFADAVIVGSTLITLLGHDDAIIGSQKTLELLSAMRASMDAINGVETPQSLNVNVPEGCEGD